MFTTKHAKCLTSKMALFLNTRNNVSTGLGSQQMFAFHFFSNRPTNYLYIKRDFNTAIR